MLDCPPSRRLILASWPAAARPDEAAETLFPRIQEIVGAIRNVRNEHKADPKKPVKAYMQAPPDKASELDEIRQNAGIIQLLALCQLLPAASPPDGVQVVRATAAGCEIWVEGVTDPAAESQRKRKAKMCEDLNRQIAALKGRLVNPGYLAKAPPHLVEQTKAQLAEAEAELAKSCA
jgi:valyl-tRNA synthetase